MKSKLIIVDPTQGDTTLEFDTTNTLDGKKAREEFNKKIRDGYTGVGESGKVSKSLDLDERETYLIMPIIGG